MYSCVFWSCIFTGRPVGPFDQRCSEYLANARTTLPNPQASSTRIEVACPYMQHLRRGCLILINAHTHLPARALILYA
jgi:hypothetical protein